MPGCPTNLQIQAKFAYADTWVNWRDSTNKTADLNKAIGIFGSIPVTYGTNAQTVLAWGRMGDCFLQLTNYTAAMTHYQLLASSPQADLAASAQARVGIALAEEMQSG